jgi:hypothetical protein
MLTQPPKAGLAKSAQLRITWRDALVLGGGIKHVVHNQG